MTKVYIFKKNDKICGFQVKGHTGYAEEGQDIVCASVSTATQMAALGLREVLGLEVEVQVREAFLLVRLKSEDLENHSAQDILKTMQVTLEEIAKTYGRFVKMEVKEDVS